MVTQNKLIDDFKKLLDDKYVYYCGCGKAFEIARSKTVEILYDIPYCFSVLGVLTRYYYIDEIDVEYYKKSEDIDKELLKKCKGLDIVYVTKDKRIVSSIFDGNMIKFTGTQGSINLDTMAFDCEKNVPYKRYNDKMIALVKELLSDEQLEEINETMRRTQTNWKNKDDLYNMMY